MRLLAIACLMLVTTARGQTVGEILAHVRAASGLDHLVEFEHGLVFQGEEEGRYGERFTWECTSDGSRYQVVRTGRLTEVESCDGEGAWTQELGGERRVCELGDRALQEIEADILTGRLLAEGTPLEFRLDPDHTNEDQVALAASYDDGRASVRVEIDRAAWRAQRWYVEVGLRRGMVYLEGDVEFGGVRFPRVVRDGERRLTISGVQAAADDDARYRMTPGVPDDHAFDRAAPANTQARVDKAHRLHVRARVNGLDAGWFLLDTGAQMNMIDPDVAKRVGIEPFGGLKITGFVYNNHPGQFGRGSSLSVGPLTMREPLFVVSRLQGEKERPAADKEVEPIVGILGFPLFARCVIEMESDARRVSVHDPAAYRLQAGEWLPMRFYCSAPIVPGTLDGRKALYRLDTGAGGGHTFDVATVNEWRLNHGKPGRPISAKGGPDNELDGNQLFLLTTAESAGLGRHTANEVLIRMARNPAGKYADTYTNAHVGMWFGRAFVLVFDYPRRRFAAEPPALWRRAPAEGPP